MKKNFVTFSSLTEESIESRPEMFKINDNFKLAVGITKNDFIVTVNGDHVILFPFGDDSFLGKPAKFQFSSTGGSKPMDVHGFDTYVMEEGIKRTKSVMIVTKSKAVFETMPMNMRAKKEKFIPTEADKQLARVFHH
jgi:hypothetical protein